MLFIGALGGDDDEKTVVVIISTRSRHYHLQDRIGSLERPRLKSLVSVETLSPSPQVQPSSKKNHLSQTDQISKLETWHWGLVLDNQRVTWTASTILVMFKRLEHLNSEKARTICSTTASHTSAQQPVPQQMWMSHYHWLSKCEVFLNYYWLSRSIVLYNCKPLTVVPSSIQLILVYKYVHFIISCQVLGFSKIMNQWHLCHPWSGLYVLLDALLFWYEVPCPWLTSPFSTKYVNFKFVCQVLWFSIIMNR